MGSSLLSAVIRTGYECRREPGVPGAEPGSPSGWGWWQLLLPEPPWFMVLPACPLFRWAAGGLGTAGDEADVGSDRLGPIRVTMEVTLRESTRWSALR